MSKLNTPRTVGAAGIALLALVVYGFLMGYHRDPELMLTVVLVRLAAGFGVGLTLAAVLAVGLLVRRQSGVIASFAKSSVLFTSVTVVALVVFNLVERA